MALLKQSHFHNVKKTCKECGVDLILKNTRDIERKIFCSRICCATYNGKNRNMNVLWEKGNTVEANAKKAHYGKNHPNWIEDRSKIKGRLRPEMTAWRTGVFTKDKYTCQECGQIGGKLNAHHKAPYSLFAFLKYDVNNGLTVCEPCHKTIHKESSFLFGGINSKRMQESNFAY